MNIEEAYKLLEVSEDISDDDLKKKYKELAKKYHPDLYKEDPNKFKKINEAHQVITDYRENPHKYAQQQGGGFWSNVVDFGDIFVNNSGFSDFFGRKTKQVEQIQISVDISFQESVLGCTKEINYNRTCACEQCRGEGETKTGNGCDKCDGFGRLTVKNNNMLFQSQCLKCGGKNIKKTKCEKCNGQKTVTENRIGNINIFPGTLNGSILRLAGEGNYVSQSMFGPQNTDVFITVNVSSYKDMHIEGNDVHSSVNISLLDALKGLDQEIETVYGMKKITIQPKTRHSDKIKIPDAGIKNKNGFHVININVDYPDDISSLIGVLQDGVSNPV